MTIVSKRMRRTMNKWIKYTFLILASILLEARGIMCLYYAIETFIAWWLYDGGYVGKVLTSYNAIFQLIIGLFFMALPFFLPWRNKKDKGK